MRAEAQPTEIDSQIDSQADLGPIKEASAIPLKRPSKTLSRWFSDKTLTKRASLNGLAALLDYAAHVLVGFIIQPVLVTGLGPYFYGVWQILDRLIGHMSAASGRPGQALKFTIAHQQTSTDYEEKRRNVGSAVVVWLVFLPVLAASGGLLTWFTPAWVKAPNEFSASVRLATALLVADLILMSLADVPRSVLQGENLGYKRMGLSTILVFVGGGFTAVAMYFKTGLIGAAASEVASTVLTGLLFVRIVRSYAPWFGITMPGWADVRRFFGLSWWFLVWRLVNQLMMASDVIVLGRLYSVGMVTHYTLTKYAAESVISLVAITVFGIAPGLGGIIGAGKTRKAIRVRSEIMMGTWLIATVMGATILLWNRCFIRLWVGEKYYAGSIPALLITLMVAQLVLIRNDANIIDLTLNLRHKVLTGTLSATMSLVFASVLVGVFHWGIVGLCLGFMVGRSILSLGYPWLVGRFLGISLYSQLKAVPRPACTMMGLFLLVPYLSRSLTVSTWIGLILSAGVTVAGVSLLAFYAGLSGDQRQCILQRIRAMLRPVRVD